MSATSGISVSPDLAHKFSEAIASKSIRFIKVSIQNESLVHDASVPVAGSLDEDLEMLQDPAFLQDDSPAYLLVRLDEPSSEWLAIYYVPDSANVRAKTLYASTRASLLRSLGSTLFTDSLFATSKSDLTPQAYASHKRHMAAPKPLSTREQEMADVRAAEREAGGGGYEGSRARRNHVGPVGFSWPEDLEEAVKELGEGEGCRVVVIKITPSETLALDIASDTDIQSLGSALPSTEPCYALFAWPHTHTSPPRREIVFVYSCPSSSPIKPRMLYSSGAVSVFNAIKVLLSAQSGSSILADRRIETSDPKELDEEYFKSRLGGGSGSIGASEPGTPNEAPEEKKPFARPKGPGRR